MRTRTYNHLPAYHTHTVSHSVFYLMNTLPTLAHVQRSQRHRSRAERLHHALLWADPGDVDLPDAERSPFAPATTAAFLKAHGIDLLVGVVG